MAVSALFPARLSVPDVSVAALAKGLDAAEDHPLPPDARTYARPIRPRVAGWMKRVGAKPATRFADESPDRLIVRSLQGEM